MTNDEQAAMRADVQMLSAQVRTMTDTLHEEYRRRQDVERKADHLEEILIPREEHRRRTFWAVVSFVVTLAFVIIFQSQTIANCFLDPNQNRVQLTICNTLMGEQYVQARVEGNARLKQFYDLIEQIGKNTKTNELQEKRLNELEKRTFQDSPPTTVGANE